MDKVKEFIAEMCEETNISLKLSKDNKEIFNNILSDEELVSDNISVVNETWKIYIHHSNKALLPFICFSLNKILKQEDSLELLIEGKKSWSSFKKTSLCRQGKAILIDCIDIDDIISIVRDTYSGQDVLVDKVQNKILIIGNLEDEKEHAFSLRETILQSVGNKVYLAIDDFDGTHEGLIKCNNNLIESINIGKALGVTPEVYIVKEMELERLVYNLNEKYAERLKIDYSYIFNKLSDELIKTLEEVLSCNLSLSKAAKNLFIHRNTLMYRIDKINKETGFDIRNFREAMILYIIYVNNKKCKLME